MSKTLIAIAATLACCSSVWADPLNAVVTDPLDPDTFASKISPSTAVLAGGNPVGVFLDVFVFSLDPVSQFSVVLSNTFAGDQGKVNFFSATLLPPGSPLGDLSLIPTSPESQTLFGTWSNLAGGIYLLAVAGQVIGTVPAGYGGAAVAIAIPEPSTYALMLAGLGAIGFVASRRREPTN